MEGRDVSNEVSHGYLNPTAVVMAGPVDWIESGSSQTIEKVTKGRWQNTITKFLSLLLVCVTVSSPSVLAGEWLFFLSCDIGASV